MYVDVLSHQPSRRRQFVKAVWRDRLRPAARAARPVVLGIGAVIVVVFGMIGFARTDPHETLLDSGYRALELFTFGGNTSAHPNPWLEIARILGPIVVGVAALRAIALLYRDQLQLLRCRWMRDHTVVAGLGTAGFTMARALDRDDWRVVVVEQDSGNPAIKGCRERGIGVVIGDATDPRILRKAGLGQAILFVAMCGDDGTNADAAASARTVTAERTRGILTTLVELDDFGLWGVMKAQAFLTRDGTPYRLHFFNTFALAAEMLLHEYPAFDSASPGSPHVLVVGTDGVGTSLVMEILKAWLNAHRSGDDRLRVTLAGPSAGDERDRLMAAHPEIQSVPCCEVVSWDVDLVTTANPGLPSQDVDAVYVSLPAETQALNVALKLRQHPELRFDVPIVVAVADEDAGVGGTIGRGGPALKDVFAFGVLRRSVTARALLHTPTETIARLSHECHVRDRLARGDTQKDDPSLRPWEELPDALRESNRLFADGIPAKLAELGCLITFTPLMDPEVAPVVLTETEVERLAPGEHARWESHMKLIGYTRGERRDNKGKTHPMIDVPYEDLPEENKEKDRAHVRSIPEVLAHAGFSIRRIDPCRHTPLSHAGAEPKPDDSVRIVDEIPTAGAGDRAVADPARSEGH